VSVVAVRNVYRSGFPYERFRLRDGVDVLAGLIRHREYFSTKGDTFHASPGSSWTLGRKTLNGQEFHYYPSDTGELPELWVAHLAARYPTESPDYMVWSCDTLIGWHTGGGWDMDQYRREGRADWVGGAWFIPAVRYSASTTRHQNMLLAVTRGQGVVRTLD
jgi:hypothetical protein